MRIVKGDDALKKETNRAKRIHKKGLKVDDIRYIGPNGNFIMTFDGSEFVVELAVNSWSKLNWDKIHSTIISGDE